ncbi:hypothetical protein POTOM_050358 [Populus tomentosa]|uniref:Uncharacterized protein n=1 Tax=Populus tomentosa TaxID=118781 RepID=A0A8X7YC12_POPTO|nr:hypothetical protein POTOM_050358 [Populus tomentosa]
MVIREVPPRTTPIQFFRELEKRLRVKHRIHITVCHLHFAIHSKFRNLGKSILKLTKEMSETGSLLDGIQLATTLGTARVKSPQREKEEDTGGIYQQQILYIDRGTYQKDTPKASGSRYH